MVFMQLENHRAGAVWRSVSTAAAAATGFVWSVHASQAELPTYQQERVDDPNRLPEFLRISVVYLNNSRVRRTWAHSTRSLASCLANLSQHNSESSERCCNHKKQLLLHYWQQTLLLKSLGKADSAGVLPTQPHYWPYSGSHAAGLKAVIFCHSSDQMPHSRAPILRGANKPLSKKHSSLRLDPLAAQCLCVCLMLHPAPESIDAPFTLASCTW